MNLPSHYHHELHEAWGKGKRFGFVKINAHQVYWYALTNAAGHSTDSSDLSTLFSEFHPDIQHLPGATSKDSIVTNEIADLQPISGWYKEGACLIGDAAHATTPNLGQGACQAIEDAYVLGTLLEKGRTLENVLQEYESIRRKKVRMIVRTSRFIGKMAHLEHTFGIWLRNLLLRSTPSSFNTKRLDSIFRLDN